MGTSATSNVYIHVIEDVISKVRDNFINNGGPGDGVLNELQGLWKLKLVQAGAILGPIDMSAMQKGAAGGNPVHDLNISNYQGVGSEDYNIVTTPLPNEMLAATPAPVQHDPVDDNDDLDDVGQGEDLNPTHLVLAQFDKVTRAKNKWKGTLRDGIMQINNKDILFNKATGEFDF